MEQRQIHSISVGLTNEVIVPATLPDMCYFSQTNDGQTHKIVPKPSIWHSCHSNAGATSIIISRVMQKLLLNMSMSYILRLRARTCRTKQRGVEGQKFGDVCFRTWNELTTRKRGS